MEGGTKMNVKKYLLPSVLVILLIGAFIYTYISYLYMPYQYKKSEVVPLVWTEFKGPLILEICHDGFEGECVYSTYKDDIKFIIDSLRELEYVTKSRGEFRGLEYSSEDLTDVGWGYYLDNQYKIIIRQLDKTNGDYELGYWVYSFDFYTFSDYVNGPSGRYYYYKLPNDVREFVYEAEDDFIPYDEMFGE